jgi:centromeric protein E
LTDFLQPQDRKKSLKVLDDTSGTVYIEGLREVTICTSDDVFKAMAEGESYRKVGETNMNDRSSRSHTIFRIIIESSDTQGEAEESGKAIMVSHLNLVDLAGSERAAQTGAVGDRFREGVIALLLQSSATKRMVAT